MLTLTIILALMFAAYAAFTYRYARYSPWRATWQGITLMAQTITMGGLVAFFVVDTAVPNQWPGRGWILYPLLVLLLLEAWAALAGLLYVQQGSRLVSERQGTGYVEPERITTTISTIEYTGETREEES